MKVLITAGPTWVKVDEVRILTSIFSGRTGSFLAKQFHRRGDKVTLLINPQAGIRLPEGVRVIEFRYFTELGRQLERLLKRERIDLIIHSAAVNDYRPQRSGKGKIPSGRKRFTIHLVPTKKLIRRIRSLAKNAVLVQFKLESKRKGLADRAFRSLKENKCDYVVANAYEDIARGRYKASLIDTDRQSILIISKASLFTRLNKICRKK